MGDTSFSGVRSVLLYPFLDANDERDAEKRNSLEPPTIREMIGLYTECIRRANHTAVVGFKDPTITSCSDDAKKRLNAYRHWGLGQIPTEKPTSPPILEFTTPLDRKLHSKVATSALTTSSATNSKTAEGFGWFGLKKLFSSTSSSSAGGAASPSSLFPESTNENRDQNVSTTAIKRRHSEPDAAGRVLLPGPAAAAVLERSHEAAYSTKRNLNPYAIPANKDKLFVNIDDVKGFDKDVRFVLWERKKTVDLSRLPWQIKPSYIALLRSQGQLPEQAEEAMIEIKKRVQNK